MDMQRRDVVLISKLYYEDNLTQQEIAKKTNLSRMKISRILQKAREEGIVKIFINYSGLHPELERAVQTKYHLHQAVVIDTSIGHSSKEQVAKDAAYYLDHHLPDGATVADGWVPPFVLSPNMCIIKKTGPAFFSHNRRPWSK